MAEESGTGRVVLVTGASRELRRSLGVIAWAALEDISLDARCDGQTHVAATNVRRIAENLGLSKDTAARALGRLIAAGLVTRTPPGRSTDGTFAGSSYRLEVELLVGVLCIAQPAAQGRKGRTPARPRAGRSPVPATARPGEQGQGALFELDQSVTR